MGKSTRSGSVDLDLIAREVALYCEAQIWSRFLGLARTHAELAKLGRPTTKPVLVSYFKLVRPLLPATPESNDAPPRPSQMSFFAFLTYTKGIVPLLVRLPDERLALRSDFVGHHLACIQLADDWERASETIKASGNEDTKAWVQSLDQRSWRWHCFNLQFELQTACVMVACMNGFEPGAKPLTPAGWLEACVPELAMVEFCPALGSGFAVDPIDVDKWFEASPPVKRPRGGRGRIPHLFNPRNEFIAACLRTWKDCGLPVTSLNGSSLAGAMAEAWGISMRSVRKVWERAEEVRPDKRSRAYFAPDVTCARCGCLKVPVWRAQRGPEPLCKRCSPARF